jgi:outer membrane receptor protein involved in Fe transport
MRDRVSAVLVQDLVHAHSGDDVEGRIVRAVPSLADSAANRPGRILALDTTRANFGAVRARGFDFSLEGVIETSMIRITPRLDITRTVDFEYRDLPAASTPLLDRAGVASPYGTVPSGRAVASLSVEMGDLRVGMFARYHTSYRDYSPTAGAPTNRRVPGQTLLDLKISRHIGGHLTLSIGANNVLDDQPPFAQVGGWDGFDQSQGDLIGREAYLEITGSI